MYPLAGPFQFPGRYPSRRSVVLANGGMVATSQPLAAYVGAKVIDDGGNAVDAAVAAALTLVVTEPRSTHLGGDAFAIIADGDGSVRAINGSGKSPAELTIDAVRAQGHERMPKAGPLSVTVPGALDALSEMVEKHGKLGLDTLLSHAIRYAEHGYPVTQEIADRWAAQEEKLRKYNADGSTYLVNGRPPRAGEVFVNPSLARTLRTIAEQGSDAFYSGDLADEIVRESRAAGCLLSLEDLAEHSSRWVDTVTTKYGDLTIHEPPPNGQGLIALLGLGILNRLDRGGNALERLHMEIEAVKLAFERGVPAIADPDFYEFDKSILSDASLDKLASEIEPRRAVSRDKLMPPGRDTVYVAAGDASGRLVSLIMSVFDGFGSGIVLPSSGIVLQNRAAGFSLSERSPNRLEPGKRPYHTIIPGLATRRGAPMLAFGVMGGLMQPQGHVQVIRHLADDGCDVQEALDAPRFRVGDDGSVLLESGLTDLAPGLRELGHQVTIAMHPGEFGGAQAVGYWDGVLSGGTDPRKDGIAVGT